MNAHTRTHTCTLDGKQVPGKHLQANRLHSVRLCQSPAEAGEQRGGPLAAEGQWVLFFWGLCLPCSLLLTPAAC